MKKNYLAVFFMAVVLFSSCSDDESHYTPLNIETQPDLAVTSQGNSIEISVLSNDSNLPSSGILSVSMPTHGEALISDPNNTPDNPSDDKVVYTPNQGYYGEDTFQYTICSSNDQCATENVSISVNPVSPVVFDLESWPFPNLSDYNFYEGDLADMEPAYGVLPYQPISMLFTDYAHKKRFVWMPSGSMATYTNDHSILDFPDGAVLIKNFYYENVQPSNTKRIIETRLMIKKEGAWVFANYIWNDSQTEAVLDLSGGFTSVEWVEIGVTKNTNYRIPPEEECFTCHKSGANSIPIGIKPQNINWDYPYSDGSLNQLEKLVAFGYLENNLPQTIESLVNWEDQSQPLDLRARSYLDINCAHCHSDLRHCDYRPIRFAFYESDDEVNLGVCVDPDTTIEPYTHIVQPANIGRSVLHFRMSTNDEEYRMPLMGRTMVHEEGVSLIESWINSLTTSCD